MQTDWMAPRVDDCPPAVGEEAETEEEGGGSYPDGEKETGKEDDLFTELTLDELKEAFRLFDDLKEGFITINRFRVSDSPWAQQQSLFQAILKEIDEEITDDEVEQIIIDVSSNSSNAW